MIASGEYFEFIERRETPKGERCKVVHFNLHKGLVFVLSLSGDDWMELQLCLVNNNPSESLL